MEIYENERFGRARPESGFSGPVLYPSKAERHGHGLRDRRGARSVFDSEDVFDLLSLSGEEVEDEKHENEDSNNDARPFE